MNWAYLMAVLLVGCSPAGQARAQSCPQNLDTAPKGDQSHPLIVLLESDPWAMVVGSDSPRFALYSDGLVIYRTDAGLRSAKLTQKESETLQASIEVDALACVLGNYEASDASDQPTRTLFVGRGGKLSYVYVYGSTQGPQVPAAFSAAYEGLVKFKRPESQAWLPDRVEVMIWPYDYAPQASIIWPDDWPSLSSTEASKRGEGYSILLPSAEYPRLIEFLRSRREKGAIEIGGKKWAADVRLPFPQEDEWMRSPVGGS